MDLIVEREREEEVRGRGSGQTAASTKRRRVRLIAQMTKHCDKIGKAARKILEPHRTNWRGTSSGTRRDLFR